MSVVHAHFCSFALKIAAAAEAAAGEIVCAALRGKRTHIRAGFAVQLSRRTFVRLLFVLKEGHCDNSAVIFIFSTVRSLSDFNFF
jgi:hypothetical protein